MRFDLSNSVLIVYGFYDNVQLSRLIVEISFNPPNVIMFRTLHTYFYAMNHLGIVKKNSNLKKNLNSYLSSVNSKILLKDKNIHRIV